MGEMQITTWGIFLEGTNYLSNLPLINTFRESSIEKISISPLSIVNLLALLHWAKWVPPTDS